MPSVALHAAPAADNTRETSESSTHSALPSLLQTPSGLAIIEIQGTIHAPFPSPTDTAEVSSQVTQTAIGRIEFPLYDASMPDDTKWMKKVYLYVGEHQRLVGEIKKLSKPLGIVRKRAIGESEWEKGNRKYKGEDVEAESLEITEVVRWKVLFQGRPEPV